MSSTAAFPRSLKSRITLGVLGVFLLILWTLSFLASQMLRKDMERMLGEQQFSTVSTMAASIQSDLTLRYETLERTARALADHMRHGEVLQAALERQTALPSLFNGGLIVYGPDNTGIAAVPVLGQVGIDYSDRDSVVAANREGKSSVSRPAIGKTLRAPSFLMTVPVRNDYGDVIGALSGVVHLQRANFLGHLTGNHYGKTGGFLLVSAKHRMIITGTDTTRIMEPSPPRGKIPVIDRFLDGEEGSLVYVNPQGKEVLQSVKQIPWAGWYLAAALPTEEAFAPIRDVQQRMLMVTLVLTVLAGAATWWVLRRQLSPMLDTVNTLAAMSDTGQPVQRLPIVRQDEIGQLVAAFNRLLEKLASRDTALQEMEWKFRALFEKGPIGVAYHEMIYDAAGKPIDYRIIDANSAFQELTGVNPQGKTVRAAFPGIENDSIDWIATFAHVVQTGEDVRIERYQAFNGHWYDCVGYRYKPDHLVAAFLDITARKQAEMALREREERYRAIYEASQDFISINRLSDGLYLEVNDPLLKALGYERDEMIGHTPTELGIWFNPLDRQRFVEILQHDSRCLNFEAPFRTKSGNRIWVSASGSIVQLAGVACIYAVTRDITQRKQDDERINELAFFDQLTGLPNRTLLFDRLRQSMVAGSRNGQHGALLLIDLDNFKTLNDSLGHDMGDLLLKQVAQRLVTCVRSEDTVARLGGDEFVVVLSNLSSIENEAATQTEGIGEKIVSALNQVYLLNEHTYYCSPSMGVNLFMGQQTDGDTLLKQTDIAMYRAKKEGGNALRFFDSAMETVVVERASLEKGLREAIKQQQFSLYYQAQISGAQLVGAEVLIRWQHPARGLVSPNEFIPLAEESGLILPLGRWVLVTACQQLAEWGARAEMAHLTVSVNVSANQFRQKDFVEQVLSILDQTGANPFRLKLEVTESMLLSNVDDVIDKMVSLKAKGVGFSLDDFGTGYSSLSYLKRLPLDQLKIAQPFVRDVLSDENDAAIATTIIALAQSFQLDVIAEGVETEAQRDYLSSVGCHAYQGYFFSRPLPLEDFERFAQDF